MDRLKEYIRNNREAFDSEAPSDNHTELFLARLNKSKKPKRSGRRIAFSFTASIAAAAVILLAIWKAPQPSAGCTMSDEEKEVSGYYTMRLEGKISEVERLALQGDERVRSEIDRGLAELQADTVSFFSELCGAGISEDEKVAIIIQHYRAKLNALDMTISSLEQALNT